MDMIQATLTGDRRQGNIWNTKVGGSFYDSECK